MGQRSESMRASSLVLKGAIVDRPEWGLREICPVDIARPGEGKVNINPYRQEVIMKIIFRSVLILLAMFVSVANAKDKSKD